VNLLNPIGRIPWRNQAQVAARLNSAAVFAEQPKHPHVLRFRGFDGAKDVCRIAARRNGNQQISVVSEGADGASEYLVKSVIVSDTGQVRRLAERNHRQGIPVFAKPSGAFLCEVERVTHASAVAAGEHTSATFKHVSEEFGGFAHDFNVHGALDKLIQDVLGFLKRVLDS
jgi:hypothetical protein